MKNVLIVSGHTHLNDSFANKLILEKLKEELPDSVQTLLDSEYPDYTFDIKTEQQKLMNADIIVLQFPLFWYSAPSILRKWMEDVFVHGFSHGSKGTSLHGKKLILSFTSGAPEEMYQEGGLQNYPIEAFLPPFKQFANLCGMGWAGHIYTGALSYISKSDEQRAVMRERAITHANRVVEQINAL